MTLVFVLLTLTVIGVVVAVALGRLGGGLGPAGTTLPPLGLPDGRIEGRDLDRVRISPALRGYRMDQVDEVLDRVGRELDRRDAELARLAALLEERAEPDADPGVHPDHQG